MIGIGFKKNKKRIYLAVRAKTRETVYKKHLFKTILRKSKTVDKTWDLTLSSLALAC